MLEETVKKQAQQILQLKKQSNGAQYQEVDPMLAHVQQQYAIKQEQANNASWLVCKMSKKLTIYIGR